MATRKGMGQGRGKGYENLLPQDPRIHKDSAKGRKQPQKIHTTRIRQNQRIIYDKDAKKKYDEYFTAITTNTTRDIIDNISISDICIYSILSLKYKKVKSYHEGQLFENLGLLFENLGLLFLISYKLISWRIV